MAVCDVCEGEMKSVPGCVASAVAFEFGAEPFDGEDWWVPPADDDRCHDCGCSPGCSHHFGCSAAICRPCSDAAGEPAQWFCCPHFIVQGEALGLED